MLAHEYSFSTATSSMVTYASRSADLDPCPRSAPRGVRGHRPTPAGTGADGLPELFAATIQSSPRDAQTPAAPYAQWPQARRATRPPGPDTGVGTAGGRGGGP